MPDSPDPLLAILERRRKLVAEADRFKRGGPMPPEW